MSKNTKDIHLENIFNICSKAIIDTEEYSHSCLHSILNIFNDKMRITYNNILNLIKDFNSESNKDERDYQSLFKNINDEVYKSHYPIFDAARGQFSFVNNRKETSYDSAYFFSTIMSNLDTMLDIQKQANMLMLTR